MNLSPLANQVLVVSATQIAALAVGGVTTYPSVLMHQLKTNDSSISMDDESASWIASVHGLSGTLNVVVPLIMQVKGRKVTFIASHVLVIIGWFLIYFAKHAATIIVGESFHGLGCNMFHIVGLIAISEMVSPRLRNISMPLFNINLVFGMALGRLSGSYFHWRTMCFLLCAPLIVTMTLVYFWPESPFWLAYRGEIDRCIQTFTSLRGTDDSSQKELASLIKSKTNILEKRECKNERRKSVWREFLIKCSRRDFYMPCLHVIVLMTTHYWSGQVVTYIYARDIFEKTTRNYTSSSLFMVVTDIATIFCAGTSCVAVRYLNTKTVLLTSIAGCTVSIFAISIITYCQRVGVLPENSMLVMYFLLSDMMFYLSGWLVLAFSISTEIMPVKHRGLGGALLLATGCLFHSITLKLFPDMIQHLDFYGTYLVYTAFAVIGFVYIWMYVPETKGKTLQEIEDNYNRGYYVKESRRSSTQDESICLSTVD